MMSPIHRNLLIGLCAIAAGILFILLRDLTPQPATTVLISSVVLSVGLLFIVFSIFQQNGTDAPDERNLRIRAYTFMKAFFFTFTVVCVLGILDLSGLLVLDSRSVIEILFLTMGLSSFLLSWYYDRQGDISEG